MSYRYDQVGYVHQPFPKWVKGVKGPQIVHTVTEEKAVCEALAAHEDKIGSEKASRESAAKEQAIAEMQEAMRRNKRK